MESLRSTYNDNWFHHVGIGDGSWNKLKIKNVQKIMLLTDYALMLAHKQDRSNNEISMFKKLKCV